MKENMRKTLYYFGIAFVVVLGLLTIPFILIGYNGIIEPHETSSFSDEQDCCALLCGINDYPGSYNDLSYCRNDVQDMYALLEGRFEIPSSHIYCRTDDSVNSSVIQTYMGSISTVMGPEDVFVFFFTGHGGLSQQGYFIELYEDRLYASEFNGILERMSYKKIVILDSCLSGGFGAELNDSNTFCITASQANEYSFEDDNLENGIFSYFFTSSWNNATDMNNDNRISLEEIFPYVYNATVKFSSTTHRTHHPQLFDNTNTSEIFL
jgi:hypothetical protein